LSIGDEFSSEYHDQVDNGDDGVFFLYGVSTPKLILSSIFTYGIFNLYWFYRNWDYIKQSSNIELNSLVRAWLFPFYMYSCFKYIKTIANNRGFEVEWSPVLLTIIYFILFSCWYIPYLFILALLPCLAILPVNKTCCRLNDSFSVKQFKGYEISKNNLILIIVGSIFVGLSVINAYL